MSDELVVLVVVVVAAIIGLTADLRHEFNWNKSKESKETKFTESNSKSSYDN